MSTSPQTLPPSQSMAELVSAFELFAGASTAIERQHAELNRHLDQLRQDLMEANERLSVLIKALPAAVLLVERGLITHFNDAAAKLIPQLRTQTRWLLPAAWIPGDGPDEYRTTHGTSARTLQLQQNHSEGRVVIQIQDITDNLRTLEESERVDRLAAMGKMSAGIAHQLRTPLSTALLYASHLSNLNWTCKTAPIFHNVYNASCSTWKSWRAKCCNSSSPDFNKPNFWTSTTWCAKLSSRSRVCTFANNSAPHLTCTPSPAWLKLNAPHWSQPWWPFWKMRRKPAVPNKVS